MAARQFQKKARYSAQFDQRPHILIAAEGKNVTEKNYLTSLWRDHHPETVIDFVDKKGATDPETMLNNVENAWKDKPMNSDRGDKAYVVLDLDCDEKKARLINQLNSRREHAVFIVSNPCFEVWFLMHFRYSTRQFASSSEVIKELKGKGCIPNYQKNMDVYSLIKDKLKTARDNAKRLESSYLNDGVHWPSSHYNPRTDVLTVVNKILGEEDDQESVKP